MKVQLIDGWAAKLFTLGSTRLAWAAGVAAGYIAANPDQWKAFCDSLPPWAPFLIGFAVTAAAGGSRIVTITKSSN